MPRRKQPAIPDELLDQFLAGSDPRGRPGRRGPAGRAQEGTRRVQSHTLSRPQSPRDSAFRLR
jgi:hypothetical protein